MSEELEQHVEVTSESSVRVPITALLEGLEGRLESRLTRQDRVLKRIDARLDNAATTEDVAKLHVLFEGHDGRIRSLEADREERDAFKVYRDRFWKRVAWMVACVAVPVGVAFGMSAAAGHPW